MLTDTFLKKKIAAAIRTDSDMEAALESKVDVVVLLYSDIMTVTSVIDRIHERGKKVIIHVDFAEGIGKDRAGLEYLKQQGADGICTTRTNLVRIAKALGLLTVQRFFMIDSHSVGTSVDSIKISRPDIVEIMPAIVTKKIREFSALVEEPVIAGGLVETEAEVKAALEAGASMVSTGDAGLWNLEI